MLQAIDEAGRNIIPASLGREALKILKKNRNPFYCPLCEKLVILKAGKKMIPHFAHISVNNCGGGEGSYHETGKWMLFQWLALQNLDVALEAQLPEPNRRPDLLVNAGGRRIAIEYQCAKMPHEEVLARMNDYKQGGIEQIWILGGNRLKRLGRNILSLDKFTQYFLHQYKKSSNEFLYFFCPNTGQFSIFQNPLFSTRRKALGNLKFIPISELKFTNLFQPLNDKAEGIAQFWRREKELFRLSASRRQFGKYLQFQQWLYLKGWHAETLPACIGLPVRNAHKMNLATFQWQAKIVMGILKPSMRHTVTIKFIKNAMTRFRRKEEQMPIFHNETDPIIDYIMLLESLGYLKVESNGAIHLKNPIELTKNVEHSLQEDKLIMDKWLRLQAMSNQKRSMIPANSAIL